MLFVCKFVAGRGRIENYLICYLYSYSVHGGFESCTARYKSVKIYVQLCWGDRSTWEPPRGQGVPLDKGEGFILVH